MSTNIQQKQEEKQKEKKKEERQNEVGTLIQTKALIKNTLNEITDRQKQPNPCF